MGCVLNHDINNNMQMVRFNYWLQSSNFFGAFLDYVFQVEMIDFDIFLHMLSDGVVHFKIEQ